MATHVFPFPLEPGGPGRRANYSTTTQSDEMVPRRPWFFLAGRAGQVFLYHSTNDMALRKQVDYKVALLPQYSVGTTCRKR